MLLREITIQEGCERSAQERRERRRGDLLPCLTHVEKVSGAELEGMGIL